VTTVLKGERLTKLTSDGVASKAMKFIRIFKREPSFKKEAGKRSNKREKMRDV